MFFCFIGPIILNVVPNALYLKMTQLIWFKFHSLLEFNACCHWIFRISWNPTLRKSRLVAQYFIWLNLKMHCKRKKLPNIQYQCLVTFSPSRTTFVMECWNLKKIGFRGIMKGERRPRKIGVQCTHSSSGHKQKRTDKWRKSVHERPPSGSRNVTGANPTRFSCRLHSVFIWTQPAHLQAGHNGRDDVLHFVSTP